MIPNPALDMYRFWREVVRFHCEAVTENLREQAKSRPQHTDVEKWSLDVQKWATASSYAPLDYRMGLSVTGLSVKHLDRGLIDPLLEQYEPIITMNVQCRRNRYALMTLWPNGDFRLDDLPSTWYQIFPRWTFFRTSYAAGRRVWTLPVSDKERTQRWIALNEADFQTHRMYVPNYSFISGALYRLEMDTRQQWRFAAIPLNAVRDKQEERALECITAGYSACERRYTRHQRAAERAVPLNRQQRLALYVPKHGRMTGMEAIAEMSRHLRVYPAPMPEEATDGSDNMVASPVHR